jgi:hypothetical protein
MPDDDLVPDDGTQTDAPAPPAAPPEYRTWTPGKVPAGSLLAVPLPPPTVHDTPSPPRQTLGPPCRNKRCGPTATGADGQPASWYYRPSGICVRCYARWDKHPLEETIDGNS